MGEAQPRGGHRGGTREKVSDLNGGGALAQMAAAIEETGIMEKPGEAAAAQAAAGPGEVCSFEAETHRADGTDQDLVLSRTISWCAEPLPGAAGRHSSAQALQDTHPRLVDTIDTWCVLTTTLSSRCPSGAGLRLAAPLQRVRVPSR